MSTATEADVKVGDEVRVFDVNGRRIGQPEGGWAGEVVKVGRKLVTIRYGYTTKVFRLDNQTANDLYCHQSYRTLEQAAQDERRERAVEVLSQHHIRLERQGHLSLEQIEALAEVARTF